MKAFLNRFGPPASVIVLVLLCAGCVQETRHGDSVKYTYQLWVPLSIFSAGLGGTVAGGLLWTFQNRYKWTLLILGVIGMVTGPSMFLDYAVVDSKGLTIRTGIPYLASSERVQFDDIQQVRATQKVSHGRRGRKSTSYYYEFDLKSGQTVAVNTNGNVLRQQAKQQIDQQLAARGIDVKTDF